MKLRKLVPSFIMNMPVNETRTICKTVLYSSFRSIESNQKKFYKHGWDWNGSKTPIDSSRLGSDL